MRKCSELTPVCKHIWSTIVVSYVSVCVCVYNGRGVFDRAYTLCCVFKDSLGTEAAPSFYLPSLWQWEFLFAITMANRNLCISSQEETNSNVDCIWAFVVVCVGSFLWLFASIFTFLKLKSESVYVSKCNFSNNALAGHLWNTILISLYNSQVQWLAQFSQDRWFVPQCASRSPKQCHQYQLRD